MASEFQSSVPHKQVQKTQMKVFAPQNEVQIGKPQTNPESKPKV